MVSLSKIHEQPSLALVLMSSKEPCWIWLACHVRVWNCQCCIHCPKGDGLTSGRGLFLAWEYRLPCILSIIPDPTHYLPSRFAQISISKVPDKAQSPKLPMQQLCLAPILSSWYKSDSADRPKLIATSSDDVSLAYSVYKAVRLCEVISCWIQSSIMRCVIHKSDQERYDVEPQIASNNANLHDMPYCLLHLTV